MQEKEKKFKFATRTCGRGCQWISTKEADAASHTHLKQYSILCKVSHGFWKRSVSRSFLGVFLGCGGLVLAGLFCYFCVCVVLETPSFLLSPILQHVGIANLRQNVLMTVWASSALGMSSKKNHFISADGQTQEHADFPRLVSLFWNMWESSSTVPTSKTGSWQWQLASAERIEFWHMCMIPFWRKLLGKRVVICTVSCCIDESGSGRNPLTSRPALHLRYETTFTIKSTIIGAVVSVWRVCCVF